MPREFREDTERDRTREIDETNENSEVDETKRDAERIAKEVSEELEEQERIKEITEDAVKKLREADEAAERAEANAREARGKLDGFEEDLGNKLEDAREKLHEDFVNDMKERFGAGSQKETSSESDERPEGGESEEKTESRKTYIEGSDGLVYEMKTGGDSESSTELEVEESPEPAKEETPEARETEVQEENAEQDVREKVRNSIQKQEMPESAETEVPSEEAPKERMEEPTSEERSTGESESYEPKRDYAIEEEVEESKETKESARIETNEERREVMEDKTDSEPANPQEVSNPESFPEVEEPSMEEAPESSVEPEEVVSEQEEFIEEEVVEPESNEDEVELPVELPEEIEQHIDELVEELVEELIDDIETQEEREETYEPRIIVDAMTGKEHVDTSLEYRPYFQETEVESGQEEQEQLDEKIDEMFDNLSEEEQEHIKEPVRSKLKTEEDLDEWITRNPSVKASPDYKEKYAEAKKYLRGNRKGSVPKLIKELWKDEVKRVWTSIVGAVLRKKLRKKLGDKLLASRILQDWTQERLDSLLGQYSDLKSNPRFKKRYRNAVSWRVLMIRMKEGKIKSQPSPEVLKELSKEFMISIPTIRKWLKGESKPMLVVLLERRLGLRSSPGGYQEPLVRDENETNAIKIDIELERIEDIVKKTNEIINSQGVGIWYFELPSKLVTSLKKQLQKLDSQLKVEVIGERIYIRKKKIDPFSWIEILNSENIYLKRKWKRELIGRVLGRLKLRNLRELSEVIRKLTDFGKGTQVPVGGINADLQSKSNHLRGCSLGLFIDILGLKLKDIAYMVHALGQSWVDQWQIRNPMFPEGEELKIILSRLFSIIASDGHIDKNTLSLTYFENEELRRQRVIEILQSLGDVYSVETLSDSQADSLRFPPILGRLMNRLGIPLGDKVLQGTRVPKFILNGSKKIQQAYLQELIPEEGSITFMVDGGLKILWGRTVVLHETRSSKRYAKQKSLKKDIVQLLKDEGEYEEKRQCYRFSAGKLRDLKSHANSKIAELATELDSIARKNSCSLLLDEKKLCKKLGINTGHHLCYVRYYVRSGRVSAHWEAHTRSQKDVEKWWKIAPPNDVKKRARIDKYFKEKGMDEVS